MNDAGGQPAYFILREIPGHRMDNAGSLRCFDSSACAQFIKDGKTVCNVKGASFIISVSSQRKG